VKYIDLLIEFMEKIISTRLYTLLETSIREEEKYQHYRNLISIIIGLDKPSVYKTAFLSEKYLRSIPEIRKYYELKEANYLEIHSILRKALYDEVKILNIQGAESLLSRILFLLASISHILPYAPDLSKYILQLSNILAIPVPPKADEAKAIDLLKPGEEIDLFVGDIHSFWIIEVLTSILNNRGYYVKLIFCLEEYETNINYNNYKRYIQLLGNKESIQVDFIKCSQLNSSTYLGEETFIIINNLILYHIIDNIDKLHGSNIYLVFNPNNTPLQKILGSIPIVISIENLRNILLKIKT